MLPKQTLPFYSDWGGKKGEKERSSGRTTFTKWHLVKSDYAGEDGEDSSIDKQVPGLLAVDLN